MSTASSGAGPEGLVAVSVVIPCHNAEATIGRAIASVLAQTRRPLEVIVVDDASTDATPARLSQLQALHGAHWLSVLRLPANRGPAAARNAGWDAARGDYVAFLDADDAWHPRKIELQLDVMRAHPTLALSGHAHRVVGVGRHVEPENEGGRGFDEVNRAQLLLSNRFTTSSVMVRKSVESRFRPDQRHMEDHMLWLTMVCGGARAARLRAELSYRYAAPFGEAGLSGNLLAMEQAELGNYMRLYRSDAIGAGWLAMLWVWSSLKFCRRLAVVALRRVSS